MCTTVSNTVENLAALYSCIVLNQKSKIRKPVFSDCGIIYILWSTSQNTSYGMISTDRTEPMDGQCSHAATPPRSHLMSQLLDAAGA